jgi:hypothetical protein
MSTQIENSVLFRSRNRGTVFSLRLLFLSAFIVLFLQYGCTNNPVEPPIKDPREYTWSIDTISTPGSNQTYMGDLWASSADNVYIVGHNASPGPGTMFRYDGKTWRTTRFHAADGGPIWGAVDISAIDGSSPSNIFAVGARLSNNYNNPPPFILASAFILQYDGTIWKEHIITNGPQLVAVSVSSPSDVWASGISPFVFHYNGSTWVRDSLPVRVPHNGVIAILAIAKHPSGDVYALGFVRDDDTFLTRNYFFLRRNGTWSVVDSARSEFSERKWGTDNLWISPSGTVYSVGIGIYRLDGSQWTKIIETNTTITAIFGTSDTNLFAVGTFGEAMHYNGTDWFKYGQLKYSDNLYADVWTDGKEAFIVGYNDTDTIIFHGR